MIANIQLTNNRREALLWKIKNVNKNFYQNSLMLIYMIPNFTLCLVFIGITFQGQIMMPMRKHFDSYIIKPMMAYLIFTP